MKFTTVLSTLACIVGMATTVPAYDVEDLSDFSNADIVASELTDLENYDPYTTTQEAMNVINEALFSPSFSPEEQEVLDLTSAVIAAIEADQALMDLGNLIDFIDAIHYAGGNPDPLLGPVYKSKIMVTIKAWAKYNKDTCNVLKSRHSRYIYSASRIKRAYYKGVMRDYCRLKVYMKVYVRNHYPVYDPYVVSE
jgi:hypothetical protein